MSLTLGFADFQHLVRRLVFWKKLDLFLSSGERVERQLLGLLQRTTFNNYTICELKGKAIPVTGREGP
jgi:hypothetical protein